MQRITLEVGDIIRDDAGRIGTVIAIVHDGKHAVIEDQNNNCEFIPRTGVYERIQTYSL